MIGFRSRTPPEPGSSPSSPGIYIGRKILVDNTGGDRVHYQGPLHLMLFGPNGVGKGMCVLAPNLLSISGRSIVVIDPKSQLAAMTAAYRREQLGDEVKILDPFGVVGGIVRQQPEKYAALRRLSLDQSAGFNPLAALTPKSPTFYDDAAVIAEALIKIQGNDPHWTESAQGLVTGLVMWERFKFGEAASLEHVREMLTIDRWEEFEERDGAGNVTRTRERQTAGLNITARAMIEEGDFAMQSLGSRFADDETDELASVVSTADTQTRWLLSSPMRVDLKKNGVDFRKLKTGERPTTVYVVLPAEFLETHSIWLRLVVSEALRACMTPGGRPVLLMLDEFAALGHLAIIERLFSVTRDYRVQMLPVLQDLPQLKGLYPGRWETMLGMAGVVQSFRAGDMTTAEWFSKRSPPRDREIVGTSVGTNQSAGSSSSSQGFSTSIVEKPTLAPHDMFSLTRAGTSERPETVDTLVYYAEYRDPSLLRMPHLKDWPTLMERALPNPYYVG